MGERENTPNPPALPRCTSQQKLVRKNISLYNKNLKIGQFKLENYTIL